MGGGGGSALFCLRRRMQAARQYLLINIFSLPTVSMPPKNEQKKKENFNETAYRTIIALHGIFFM
jgi:hypothetical protein